MDVQAETGGEKAIRRIIALLVSFAVLAERAAARPWPVRCLVLWILRFAADLAADYVLDVTGAPAPAMETIAACGDGPAGAFLLAARFRALAAALGVFLRPVGRPSRAGGYCNTARQAAARVPFGAAPACASRAKGPVARGPPTTRRTLLPVGLFKPRASVVARVRPLSPA